MIGPITKWRWTAQTATGIPETTRRALKFAATPPGGPVFLAIPDNELRDRGDGDHHGQVAVQRADEDRGPTRIDVEKAARMLIEAKNPLLSVGDEITLCRGEKEVVELAELLGLPVAGQDEFGVWSKPFPTRNALYIGPALRNMRFPGEDRRASQHRQPLCRDRAEGREAHFDPPGRDEPRARRYPVDLAMVADVRLGHGRSHRRREEHGDGRPPQADRRRAPQRTRDYTKQARGVASDRSPNSANNGTTIRRERLAVELENGARQGNDLRHRLRLAARRWTR